MLKTIKPTLVDVLGCKIEDIEEYEENEYRVKYNLEILENYLEKNIILN